MSGSLGSRRGVALVLVLAAVLVVLTALAAAMSIQGDARLAAHLDRGELEALLVRDDADAIIRQYLAQQGDEIRSDPDAAHAPILLCDDHRQPGEGAPGAQGEALLLRIQLWDALAGVPGELAHRGGPLQQALPPEWQQLNIPPPIARSRPPARPPTGPGAEGEQARRPPIGMLVETLDLPGRQHRRYPPAMPDPDAEPALALILATGSEGRININTAPAGLLEDAARYLKRELPIDEILTARRMGELADLPAPPSQAGRQPRQPQRRQNLRLVDRSDRWLVRIDYQRGTQRFAWWAVYAGDAEAAQRLVCHAIQP